MAEASSDRFFLSYASEDAAFLSALTRWLRHCRISCFNTTTIEDGITAGEDRAEQILDQLHTTGCLIAVMSDSYLRSVICLSELSAFWYSGKPVIPIVFSEEARQTLNRLFGKDLIYVDAIGAAGSEKKSLLCAQRLISAITARGVTLPEGALEDVKALFEANGQAKPSRPFIGSEKTYDNILRYCEQFGIQRIQNSTLPTGEIIRKLHGKREIFILSTTGMNLISGLSSRFFGEALRAGCDITVLIANKASPFCKDVAEIEEPEKAQDNLDRLSRAFEDIVFLLDTCVEQAQQKAGGKPIGRVFVGSCHTLLRQTITLGAGDDGVWGWLSMTLPPLRTNDGTPSFEFLGQRSDGSFASLAYRHVTELRDLAQRRGTLIDLGATNERITFFELEHDTAREKWAALAQKAKLATNEKLTSGEGVLIEVAAQHPLLRSGRPAPEFRARLDQAAALYEDLTEQGEDVMIYVPGSLHCHKGKADSVSLSEAGTTYLKSKGIPEEALFGDDANRRYKGDQGVYNSADECFVAAQLFLDGDYSKLYCVCSPGQMMRKKLFYMAFGVMPWFYTVPTAGQAHDDIYELFSAIPDVIYRDHTWQDSDSRNGNRTRDDRMPERVFSAGKPADTEREEKP